MDGEAMGASPADAGQADKLGPPVKKAKQKTPEQKAALEDVFTGNQHPDETVRTQLSQSLGLTIQEVTAWFQNKRRRAKNKAEAVAAAQDRVQFANGVSLAINPPSGPASSNPNSVGGPNVVQPATAGSPEKSTQSLHIEQSPPPTFLSLQEYTAHLQLATQALLGPSGCGPEVSCFFDDPPYVGTTTGGQKRRITEVTAPRKAPRKDPQAALQKQLEEEEKRAKKTALKAEREQAKLDVTLKKEQERRMRESAREKLRAEKEYAKHQADEAKAEERRQKALAKEQEKQQRAAKREQAKAMREEERRQKLAEKEAMREQAKKAKLQEKMDKKKQRELVKQQKEAEKKRSKTVMSLKLREVDPPDDLEIEMALLKEQALSKITIKAEDEMESATAKALELEITRPPFPPAHITERLQPAFVGRLAEHDCELGGQFLMLWSFIAEFSPVIAFRPISLQHLMEAVLAGSLSEALVNLHIAFIRFIQSEAEIANAIGSVHVGMERMSQTVSRAAGLVSEALSWGLDIASWRAHLNGLTWPEVLRQLALTAGWGPRRCRPARAARAYDDRRLGEDVVEGDNGELTFVWPSRFQPSPAPGEHTMKEACWKVLADMAKTEAEVANAAAGLPVREIARRIDAAQLRNNKSATIVEGSVAGALSRDSLFAYVAPGTYALQAVVAYWRKHKDRLDRKARGEEEPEDELARAAERAAAAEAAAAERAAALEREQQRKKEEEDEDDEEEDEEEETAHEGRAWVEKLLHQEYDTLSIEERVEALSDLLHLALDMPSVHSALDRRFDDVERAKRNIRDRAKEERKVRQLEMAQKAKQDAAEAEARVAALRQQVINGEDAEMAYEEERAEAAAAAKPVPMEVDDPNAAAADAAAAKLRTELETAQRNEREANSTAAEAHQRESLGRQLHEIELANAIRDEPIGMDRRFNRYRWYGQIIGAERRLLPDRMLFESGETGALQMFTDFSDVEAVRATLEPKGVREAALARTCDFCAAPMAAALRRGDGAGPAALALPAGPAEWPAEGLARLQEAQFARFLRVTTAGMEVLGEDGGVRSTDYLPTDAAAMKKLKTEMLCIESAIPEQAMINPSWDRVSWIKGAQGATNLEELRQLLGALEHNLRKGWLSPTYIREPVLVKKAFNPVGKEVAAVALASQNDCMRLRPADVHPEVNDEPLAWLPATTAGLMLRLLCLDAAVCYSTELRPWRERLSMYRYVQNPVLLAGKGTAEQGSIATVCGLPTYTGVGIFPVLPPALVPVDPVPLKLDADALLRVDDEELRSRIPAGLKQSKAAEPGPSTKKAQPKKKAKKRPSDDDDVTRAADIISSDDDFAFDAYSYQYAQAAAGFRDPQETPVESAEDAHDDPNDPEASLSETPDEEEDDADFVG